MNGHEKTVEEMKSGQEVAKSGAKVAKSGQASANRFHVDYWKKRLFRKAYTWEGKACEVDEWSVRLQHLGRREAFALGTANAGVAASKAKEIAGFLDANGWDATREKFKPDTVKKAKAPTVGEYLEAVRAVANIEPVTFNNYAGKFRTLVAGVIGLESKKIERPVINDKTGKVQISRKTGKPTMRLIDPRFDYVHGGSEAWRAKVDATPLDRITPERVQRWATARLQSFAANPAKAASARTTMNSILRAGSSLFVNSITRHLSHLALPKPLPFEGIDKLSAPRRRYESRISIEILNRKAEIELRDAVGLKASDQHEMFTIYLLALFAGLRRDEIDSLQWSQIDRSAGRVFIETNEHTSAKSDNSEGSVGLAPDVLEYLKSKYKKRTGIFVIESPVKPRPALKNYHHYRCERLFNRLNAWLRESGGVVARTPLHTLRKEFGSFIARKFGIFAASEALRHGDIRLTRDYYLAPDNRATFGPSAINSA